MSNLFDIWETLHEICWFLKCCFVEISKWFQSESAGAYLGPFMIEMAKYFYENSFAKKKLLHVRREFLVLLDTVLVVNACISLYMSWKTKKLEN